MRALADRLELYARTHREHPALVGGVGETVCYGELPSIIERLAEQLRRSGVKTIGLFAPNAPDWVLCDLAALKAECTLVPFPLFFSAQQLRYLTEAAGTSLVLVASPTQFKRMFPESEPFGELGRYQAFRLPVSPLRHSRIAKITFTSGTTGAPKGVCLGRRTLEAVASSLTEAVGINAADKHLTVLPLSILLENIAGVYAPLLAAATVYTYASDAVGIGGSSTIDPGMLLDALNRSSATTAITSPEILLALLRFLEERPSALPTSLRFLAVGSSSISPRTIAAARRVGLPVFEGYGLSEAGSVVALNTAVGSRHGSVGRILPHVEAKIVDGEVAIRGALFSHYLNEAPRSGDWYFTGDLGRVDEDNYLYLEGRQRNVIVSSYGRNISPEWIESELSASPLIRRAVVSGEGRPWLAAVIFTGASKEAVEAHVAGTNELLPDYARVKRWIRVDPDHAGLSMLDAARTTVLSYYRSALEDLYEDGALHDIATLNHKEKPNEIL